MTGNHARVGVVDRRLFGMADRSTLVWLPRPAILASEGERKRRTGAQM
jgi:hypothetical protein